MIVLGALPLMLGGLLAFLAPQAAARLDPRWAATTLTALSLIVALCTGVVLTLAAALGFASAFPKLAPSDWSIRTLRADSPIPVAVGLAAAVVATTLMANAFRHLALVCRQLHRAHRSAALFPSYGELAVADDDERYAFAVPGRPSRIVVSTALLRCLSGEQRTAVLAHERSHLEHKHFVYLQTMRLAAAANPLLRPVVRNVDVALERWADADAVRAVDDPRVVAHAIAAASLGDTRVPAPALGAGGSAVVDRVRYLLDPPAVQRRLDIPLVLIGVACCVGAGVALIDVHTIVEAAESFR